MKEVHTTYVVLKELDFNKIKPLGLTATLQDILEPMNATTGMQSEKEATVEDPTKPNRPSCTLFSKGRNFKRGRIQKFFLNISFIESFTFKSHMNQMQCVIITLNQIPNNQLQNNGGNLNTTVYFIF